VLARILTTVVGLPLFVLALWAGGMWWVVVVAVLMLGGTIEFVRLYPVLTMGERAALGAGVVGIAALIAWGPISVVPWGVALAGGIVIVGGLLPLVVGGDPSALARVQSAWLMVLLGVAYLGGPAGVLMRWRDRNFAVVAIFFALVWANDMIAYFIGTRYGRHKLAPRISPGKSWEGALAGLLVAGSIGAISGSVLGLSVAGGALFGGIISIAAQVGDLFESALKRIAGVKDSGAILPGHGGILDRFDGVLFAALVGFGLLRAWIP
jgi:phosphatidate cytidylyltransferase